MSSRVDSRHDRKRGRSRSPERKSRNVSVKSSSSRDRGGNSGNFKAPPAPKDKITQILQVKADLNTEELHLKFSQKGNLSRRFRGIASRPRLVLV